MDVLQFGVRHDRPRLRDLAAPQTLFCGTLENAREKFSSLQVFIAWVCDLPNCLSLWLY